jgi:hypothetical protein
MGRDAMSKFSEAKELDKQADALRKRDPGAAVSMDNLARRKRRQAIRQMNRRPKRSGGNKLVV